MTFTLALSFVLITYYPGAFAVSAYLHRSLTHGSITFKPWLAHIMRFYIWIYTGYDSRIWIIMHRFHHHHADKLGDPHSPHLDGFINILVRGLRPGVMRTIEQYPEVWSYSQNCPDDRIEHQLYRPYALWGPWLLLIIELAIFGPAWGLAIWLTQRLLIIMNERLFAVLGHWTGYRNADTPDHSTNWLPWGLIMMGEELHNNHHKNPANPKFSKHPWEFDPTHLLIRILVNLNCIELNNKTSL